MSSQDNPDWCMLGQDLIFQKIMMMVGLDNLKSLHRCEQVSTAWNAMIMQNIWESPSKRNIIKMKIKIKWGPGIFPSEEDIFHAKWLGKGCIQKKNCRFKDKVPIMGGRGLTKP